MNIGNFIRDKRIRLGLTQSALAKQLNVANTTVSNYENGKSLPDLNTFMRLSFILGLTKLPLVTFFDENTQYSEVYEQAYDDFYKIIKDISCLKLEAIPANPEWKCSYLKSRKCFIIAEKQSENVSDNTLVIAPVPEGEEHLYKAKHCGKNTYLIPESAPNYLPTLKIDKSKIHLKRIVAIIQYP